MWILTKIIVGLFVPMAVYVVVKCLQVLGIENAIAFVMPKNEFNVTVSLLSKHVGSSSSFSRVLSLDYKTRIQCTTGLERTAR
jgi:hypothetical protein